MLWPWRIAAAFAALERKMATHDDLVTAESGLKQAIADAATRISAKLDGLHQQIQQLEQNQQPPVDLSSDVAEIQQDIAALQGIASDTPEPAP